MQSFLQTYIVRHQRENLKKCSLSGLESREDMQFFTYPKSVLPDLDGHLLLVLDDAPPLTLEDKEAGLLILDSTWRYLDKMVKYVDLRKKLKRRTLPSHF